MENNFRYWAFISYSHADRKWGDWLHHALETHRIPKPLVGQETQRGEPVPPRVFPVFRDREELPTSANLGTVIGEALRESRYLIVICSPRAALSRWVNQEILDYKRLGRENRILALIVDGEPNAADGKPGFGADMECFPEALKHPLGPDGELEKSRRTEPIAADARSDRDGKLNAKLKLLAGLLGVNYDDLKRRDEERRRRQQRLAVSISTALVLVFAALAGTAAWQWRAADAQKRQALQTLSQSDFLQANRLIADGRRVEALAYLVRSLSADQDNHAALTRMTTLLATHSWMVPVLTLPQASAQFSPDGQRIVVAGEDRSVQVWDPQSGEPMTAALPQPGKVWDAHFSADGKQIISFGEGVAGRADCSLRTLDAANGKLLGEISLQDCQPVTSFAFSADGERIVVLSQSLNGLAISSSTVRAWDVSTGRLIWTLPKGDGVLGSLWLSPDGNRIVTSGTKIAEAVIDVRGNPMEGGGIKHASPFELHIWDVRSGQSTALALPGDTAVHSVAFSPDGRQLVIADQYGTRVWDPVSGRPLTAQMDSGEETQTAEFSPDGKRLLTASAYEQNGMARIWDAASGQPLTPPMQADTEVYTAHFSPDGKRIVIVSGVTTGRWVTYSTARIWDADSGQPLTETLTIDTPIDNAQFSPDGRRLVTVAENSSRIWELRMGAPGAMVLQGDGVGSHARFSPDGSRIVTASSKALQLWDARTGRVLAAQSDYVGVLQDLRFSPDGKLLIGVTKRDTDLLMWDTAVHTWDAADGQPLNEPPRLQQRDLSGMPEISPDGSRFVAVTQADRRARLFDVQSGRPLVALLGQEGAVVLTRFSSDGKLLLLATDGKTSRVWDVASGRPVGVPFVHSDKLVSADFSPDGHRLVTGANDSTVRIWDVVSGKLLAKPFKQGLFPAMVKFSPDGRHVLTYSIDADFRIWDAYTGEPLLGPIDTGGEILSAEFSADGQRLITAANDQIQVWDAASGQPITDALPRAATSAQFSPDGKRIVTASGRVYDLVPAQESMPQWLLPVARAFAGQFLDKQGVLESAADNNAKLLHQVSDDLTQASDDWSTWGRWFLADSATRSVSPFSQMTQPANAGDQSKPSATPPPAFTMH